MEQRNSLCIKINPSEKYIITFDKEEMETDEFFGFLERLKEIEKVISKGNFSVVKKNKIKINKGENRKGRRGSFSWNNDRAKVLEVLKKYYFGTQEEKDRICEEENNSWKNIVKNIWYLRKKYNIQPKELGFRYFPSNKGRLGIPQIEQARMIKSKEVKPIKLKVKPIKSKPKKEEIGEEYNDTNH